MARVVTFVTSTSPKQQTWTADKDYLLLGGESTTAASNWVVSTDPSLTTANLSAPSATFQSNDILFWCGAGNTAGVLGNVEINQGTVIYVASTGAASLLLFLDEPLQLKL
jgi:hypothetical protein